LSDFDKENGLMSEYGYAGTILKVDLSSGDVGRLPTADYAGRFLGGRGIAAKLFWDMVPPGTRPFEAANCIVITSGPLDGFPGFAGCRWQVCSISPEMDPESFSYANLGGSWGAWLKYAGYDGIVITGKAERPAYLYLDSDVVKIRDASHLWGRTATDTEDILKAELGASVRSLEIGPAAENMVVFSNILASDLASGSSGLGSVFGAKKLKAIAVRADEKIRPTAADPERLRLLARRVREMRDKNWEPYPEYERFGRFTACYGCIAGCSRRVYRAENGREFKWFCQAALAYVGPAEKYAEESAEVYRMAARLNDKYGLDSVVMEPLVNWIIRCYENGILSEEETGLPLSKIGSAEFIETLVRKIAFREGFGDVLAQGTIRAAATTGRGSEKLISASNIATTASEKTDYDPRYMLANVILYATEPRRPIHSLHTTSRQLNRWLNWLDKAEDAFVSTEIMRDIAEKYWGSADAADFSTYEGKALASKTIQDYNCVKESLIICDLTWPIFEVHSPDREMRCCTLESQIVSAITGRDLDEAGLMTIGERIANLQRAVMLRQGRPGREGDRILDYYHEEPLNGAFFSEEALAPGPGGEIITRKGAVIERDKFEQLKDEYYRRRGWDVPTGLPTTAGLERLDLADIARDLKERGLAV
jgi:aldehyde:ferredoxin oxidoreductase